jgi:hypothetical protein
MARLDRASGAGSPQASRLPLRLVLPRARASKPLAIRPEIRDRFRVVLARAFERAAAAEEDLRRAAKPATAPRKWNSMR